MTVGPAHLRPAHSHIRFREGADPGAAVGRIPPLEGTAAGIPPRTRPAADVAGAAGGYCSESWPKCRR